MSSPAKSALLHLLNDVLTPCQRADLRPHSWTSNQPEERARAAQLCGGCPVLAQCREAGQHEPWGVWGGRDRSKNELKGVLE